MKTYLIGVGGVGGYFGGMLQQAGFEVTFVARGEQYQALTHYGLTICTSQETIHLPSVSVIEHVSQIVDPDLILIFVKTSGTKAVAEQLKSVVSEKTVVLTFQTGFENDHILQAFLPNTVIYPGLAYINAKRTAPGVIEQISGLCTLTYGPRNGVVDDQLTKIQTHFEQTGLKIHLTSHIELEIWKKLIWICSFSGATVLFRSEIGRVLNHPDGEALFRRILDEAFLVADACQIPLSETDREEILSKIAYHQSIAPLAKTSLLSDIENGQRTEVETLHCALLAKAREHELKTPLLETIATIIRVHDAYVK